jgi:hypothetical protein
MTMTIDDQADGSQFDVDIQGGSPTVGSLLVLAAKNGTDRRVYCVQAIQGAVLTVQRLPVSHGVYL